MARGKAPLPPVRHQLRYVDQETARVVAIHRPDHSVVGAGCLVDCKHILTCRHVIGAALGQSDVRRGQSVFVTLVGVAGQPTVTVIVKDFRMGRLANDLALLEINENLLLDIPRVEFASTLRHGDKSFSVMGFPQGDKQGRNARGRLNAVDAMGLVQMDREGALLVEGGFSGAPVWSPDVGGFVGLVVTELSEANVSWCIPSRTCCEFFNELPVRFHIPQPDRPQIHDYDEDDPNVQLFGTSSDNGQRRLRARITERRDDFWVTLIYECVPGSMPARGRYVTFITYPDFKTDDEDGYEYFSSVENRRAEAEFPTDWLFTVAAIGDAGDSVLTLDLESVPKKRRRRS